MSTIHRRKRASRLSLGPYKRHELLTGKIVYPVLGYSGYGDIKRHDTKDVAAFISDEMRADWAANRDELIAFWQTGDFTTHDYFLDSVPWLFEAGGPGELPWAALQFDK